MFRKIRSAPTHKPRENNGLYAEKKHAQLCGEKAVLEKAKDKFVRIEYRNDFRGKAEKDNGFLLDYYKGKAIYKHGPRHGEKAGPVFLEERKRALVLAPLAGAAFEKTE